ncbi:MAG: hypothetical protein LBG14_06675 [Treponema sp.]|jgi:hypothetical protein|nr:hypothetical protein [Treponema sp.]
MGKRKKLVSAAGDFLRTNTGIFAAYMAVSFIVILAFRFVFPGEDAPLENFFLPWRFARGIADFIGLFPALVMSALVIPFGFTIDDDAGFARFSPLFILKIQGSILAAIIASACYGLLFFAVLPMAQEAQSAMLHKGELFRMAKQRAELHAAQREWEEARRFLNICENIWYLSPPMERLRQSILIGAESIPGDRQPGGGARESAAWANGSGAQRKPVRDAREALSLARAALAEERSYDAHWLASLALRLAREGSMEAREAVRVASLAWNAVSSLEPGIREARSYSLYQLKRQGYEAMIAREWIRSYYIFRELSEQTPDDPDVANFLAMSREGAAGVAFFIDELEGTIGQNLTNPVFSIPLAPSARTLGESALSGESSFGGRAVLRAESLLTYPDYSYAIGLDLIAFDGNNAPLYEARAQYAKFVPMTVRGKDRLVILLRALDRYDETVRWEPVWEGPGRPDLGDAQIALDASYEHFLRLSKTRLRADGLFWGDLLTMGRDSGNYGYLPQVFQAEIIRRVAQPMVLLPLSILAILIGWRFRAAAKPRFLGLPMLGIIPLVFDGAAQFIYELSGLLGLALLLSLGYSPTLGFFVGGSLILFILSLILLAAQHG